MEFITPLLVFRTQMVDLLLIFGHFNQKLGIHLLSCQEFVDDILDITKACNSSDFGKCVFNLLRAGHLLGHFVFEESGPKLLHQQVFVHFKLI